MLHSPDTSWAAKIAEAIAGDFYNDRLDLSAKELAPGSAWLRMPEVECVSRLRDSGASDRMIRLFITFIAAMDRARDATRLWNDGVELFLCHQELFEPCEVSAVPIPLLRRILSEYRVSQRHGIDSKAWNSIARSLSSDANPISQVVAFGTGDANELLSYVQSRYQGQSCFPLLRGPKIRPMWIRMLAAPGGANIKNMNIIPVAVDTHIRRVTGRLGVLDTRNMSEGEARYRIQQVWQDAVDVIRIGGPPEIANTCAALDPALWAFGKFACRHWEKTAQLVPIKGTCDHS